MPHMEDALDLPLRVILPQMQARIVYDTRYFGVQTLKNPLDFWVYQEILFAERPDFIVEIGNRYGGSTLAFAHLCDLLGHGQVIGLELAGSVVASLLMLVAVLFVVGVVGGRRSVASSTPPERQLMPQPYSATYTNTSSSTPKTRNIIGIASSDPR